jgi:hypothetical protein
MTQEDKEYKELAVLSARLAESVLMDWDEEEQVRLAKDVAIKCHLIFNDNESREFVSLVNRMREAQKDVIYKSMFSALDSAHPTAYEVAKMRQVVFEKEVDEYLKKMEE